MSEPPFGKGFVHVHLSGSGNMCKVTGSYITRELTCPLTFPKVHKELSVNKEKPKPTPEEETYQAWQLRWHLSSVGQCHPFLSLIQHG